MTHDQAVQQQILDALLRIEALLREQKQAEQQKPRRGRPPKVKHAEDDRS